MSQVQTESAQRWSQGFATEWGPGIHLKNEESSHMGCPCPGGLSCCSPCPWSHPYSSLKSAFFKHPGTFSLSAEGRPGEGEDPPALPLPPPGNTVSPPAPPRKGWGRQRRVSWDGGSGEREEESFLVMGPLRLDPGSAGARGFRDSPSSIFSEPCLLTGGDSHLTRQL